MLARWPWRASLLGKASPLPSLVHGTLSSTTSPLPGVCRRSRTPAADPPRPKRIPFTVSAHQRQWQDPYHWMSDKKDPDLVDHLRQENLYHDAFMADADGLRRTLVSEMRSRMPPRLSGPPERWGPWLYYQYIPQGREYPVLCRRWEGDSVFSKLSSGLIRRSRKGHTLLDWNDLAEKFGYVHVGTCRVSPDHRFLAYTVDTCGQEVFRLHIKDLQTGNVIEDLEATGVSSLAWAVKNDRLFYTTCDETQRPFRVFCKRLGSRGDDEMLFTENDTMCCVDIACTKDGKYITINSNTRTSSEVYVVDSSKEQNELMLVQKRVFGVQYFVEHHHGFLYILTNSSSSDTVRHLEGYHLVRCSAEKFPLSRFQDFILPGKSFILQDIDLFDGHLVLFLQKGELPMYCSIEMPIDVNFKMPFQIDDLNPWFFPLPASLCNIVPGLNQDFMASVYRVVISSPVIPDIVVDYNMGEKTFSVVHQEQVLGLSEAFKNSINLQCIDEAMNPGHTEHLLDMESHQKWVDLSDKFKCERMEVTSCDGAKVPLTILYSPKAWRSKESPGLLHGYGSYGETLDKSWCVNRISLLERGWVIAFADVRGGGGLDPSWHEAGRGPRKLNSVLDFAACAVYLVNEGYVNKRQLCATGHSAGGLLVAATINMYSDLFCAAILKVPFLDVCHTMLDPTLPLTSLDYEEFGDPKVESEFELIRSYSPYDNIPSGICFPQVLVTASFHDSRVGVWEAAKWVAKVRDCSCPCCSRRIILRTNMTGGHFGEGGRFQECEETALDYAFLIKATGRALEGC
ncbi:prolyl oligopeptidase family protein [Wolffia australiana]